MLDGVCALSPTMPVQSARVVSNLSVKNLGKRVGAVLKACEVRAIVELTKFLQVKLDNLYLIGIDCPGTFEVADYAKISVEEKGGEKLIRIAREEPKWLAGVPALENGRLSFREVSSGTLPFMDFIARHEGTTVVRILLPRGFRARSIGLSTGSGAVTAAADAAAMRVLTGSGAIRYDGAGASHRVRAFAKPGRIAVGGKTLVAGVYEAGSGPLVELISGGGTIEIR